MQLERVVCAYVDNIYVVHHDASAWPLRVFRVPYLQDFMGPQWISGSSTESLLTPFRITYQHPTMR